MRSEEIRADEFITMWTVQTKKVMDVIDKEGVSYIKKKYIDDKYKDTAWIFREAYRFFSDKASRIIPKPEEAESPVWMFCNKSWAVTGRDSVCIKLRIPRDEVVLFDLRTWSKVLNLSFAGTEQQEEAFAQELKKLGIHHPSEVFEKPYYPLIKSKIVKSWESLFAKGDTDLYYTQGAAWQLKKEWIVY